MVIVVSLSSKFRYHHFTTGVPASASLAGWIAPLGDGKSENRSPIDSLSDRELEAFELIGEGMTTESIADKMHISPKTVETFRARIKEKLGLSNMTELIQRAAQWVLESKSRSD